MVGTHFYDLKYESDVVKPEYDSEGYLKMNQKIVDHLMSHSLPIQNLRNEKDSAIYDHETISLKNSDIVSLKQKFDRNYGEFSDGKYIRLDKFEYYFKFSTNLSIAYEGGVKRETTTQKLFSLISLKSRAKDRFFVFSVFVNGLKVPDEKVYLYMLDSGTDILIPDSYLHKNADETYSDVEIYIQKRIYPLHGYFSELFTGVTSKVITISYDENKTNYGLKYVYKYDNNGHITSEIDKCRQILIFENGQYRDPGNYTFEKITANGVTTLSITLSNNIQSHSDIEVIFDPYIKAINTIIFNGNYTADTQTIRCYFNMPEEGSSYKMNYLFGSLPKNNCYFFINSKRISNDNIKQIARMNYMYSYIGTPAAPYVCTMIYTDQDTINEARQYIYGDDYYASNMLGTADVSKILDQISKGYDVNSEDAPVKFNKYLCNKKFNLDFEKIFNKNGSLYAYSTGLSMNKMVENYRDYETKVKKLIEVNGNYMVRDFLNLYSKNDIFKEEFKDDNSPEYYSYSFDTRIDKYDKTIDFFFIIDLNGDHLKESQFKIEKTYQHYNIKIPSKVMKKGQNRIHIREYSYNTKNNEAIEYKMVNPTEVKTRTVDDTITAEEYTKMIADLQVKNSQINEDKSLTEEEKTLAIEANNNLISTYKNAIIGTYKYYYTFNKFESPKYINDYILLIRSENVAGLYYSPNSDDKGWVIKKDISFTKNSDGTITLLMGSLPTAQFAIYSKCFSFKFHTNISKNITEIQDMTIPIISGDIYELPVIPSGSYTVFLNGERLYNGIDYVFRHPGNYDLIAYTSLCLKRKTKVDDEIDVYFDDIKNITVGYSNDILSHSGTVWNKYGLIYFGNLNFPYSPRYIDLYVNGKYIYPDQIDILSNKLIRIDAEIENPMFDIFAETSFNTDMESLQKFYTYKDTEFEKAIKDIFTVYDFSTLTNPMENNEADTTYESFDDDVDSWLNIPNVRRAEDSDEAMKIADSKVPLRYNLYENAYLIWLHSNATKTIMKPSENIKDEIIKYFKFYIEDYSLSERFDIAVSSRNTKLFNNLVFNYAKYPMKYSERALMLSKFAKANSLPTQILKYNEKGFLVTDNEKSGNRHIPTELIKHYPISNAMYPRDFPKAISSRTPIAQTNRDIELGGYDSKGKPLTPIYTNTSTHKNTEESNNG